MATSPNVLNYYEGKGNCYWTPDGDVERHIGNAPSVILTPTSDQRKHYSSMESVRTPDKVDTITQEGTLQITLEEITAKNLSLLLFGEVTINTDGKETFEMFGVSKKIGQFRFEGVNAIGQTIDVTVHQVEFSPSEGFNFIGEDYATIVLNGDVTKKTGKPGLATFVFTESAEASA